MSEPRCILVVDDEPHMLRYLRTILEVDSYRVETVSSGREALQWLQKSPGPDLILRIASLTATNSDSVSSFAAGIFCGLGADSTGRSGKCRLMAASSSAR